MVELTLTRAFSVCPSCSAGPCLKKERISLLSETVIYKNKSIDCSIDWSIERYKEHTQLKVTSTIPP
mgnify:CR=1 FL=1